MPGGKLGLSSLGSEGGGSLKMFSLQLMYQSGVRVKYPKNQIKASWKSYLLSLRTYRSRKKMILGHVVL